MAAAKGRGRILIVDDEWNSPIVRSVTRRLEAEGWNTIVVQPDEGIYDGDEFERAATRKPRGLLGEYADYLWSERKWWLAPVIFFLLLASGFVVLGGSGLAPFIYAIF